MSLTTRLFGYSKKIEAKPLKPTLWEAQRAQIQELTLAFLDAKRTSDIIVVIYQEKTKKLATEGARDLCDVMFRDPSFLRREEIFQARSQALQDLEDAVIKAEGLIPQDGQPHIEKYNYLETKRIDIYLAKLELAYDYFRSPPARIYGDPEGTNFYWACLTALQILINHPHENPRVSRIINDFWKPTCSEKLRIGHHIQRNHQRYHSSLFIQEGSAFVLDEKIIPPLLVEFESSYPEFIKQVVVPKPQIECLLPIESDSTFEPEEPADCSCSWWKIWKSKPSPIEDQSGVETERKKSNSKAMKPY